MHRIDGPGATVDNKFTEGDPVTAVPATEVTDDWANAVQEELAGLVEFAGLALNKADNTQLLQAVQLLGGKVLTKSVAGGAAVTLSAAESRNPVILLTGALTANINVIVPAAGRQWVFANNTTGAFTITVKTAANPGVVVAQGTALHLYCDSATVFQVGASAVQKQLQSINAVPAAGALTLSLAPTTLDFRATPLTSGTVNTRTIAAALSLVVPSGATLGTANGVASRLAVLAIDNAGSVELAVANLAGGVNLDETTLINTTAISGSSNAANVIYSAAARSGVPFRFVGFVDSTQPTAGGWSATPSTIQGGGGQALAAVTSLGAGQTWQSLTGSRAFGTTYTNTTGRPIYIQVSSNVSTGSGSITVNGVLVLQITEGADSNQTIGCIVPPGGTYSVTGAALIQWSELR